MNVDIMIFFFFKQKTAYEMRISDWSSDVCSSDLLVDALGRLAAILASHSGTRTMPGQPGADVLAGRAFGLGPGAGQTAAHHPDRKRGVSGKSVSVRVDLGGRRIIKKKNT